MTKSELKTNMLVITRESNKYLVKKNLPAVGLTYKLTYKDELDLFICEEGGYMSFYEYSEDLLCYDDDIHQTFYGYDRDKIAEQYDIMEVYAPCNISAFTSKGEFNLDNYTLLWAREEPKDEPKEDPEIQELHKMVESIEWALAEIKTVLERKEKENDN